MNNIIVSVCVITYNHCDYIRQCLDGILMQKVDFPIEIIINDDCSTDGTREIIQEYERNYPELFVATYQVENQYSKGIRGMYARFCFPKARGKYIALCEGDDYWTDPLKLQKQVCFLEQNPQYVICSHIYNYYFQNSNQLITSVIKEQEYDLDFLIYGGWLFHPLTVMFRKSAIDIVKLLEYKIGMDAVLFYHILHKGKGYCIDENMAVYRIHDGGVWSNKKSEVKLVQEFEARISIYDIDGSDNAAKFLLTQFTKPYGRKELLKHCRLLFRTVHIVRKHFGLRLVIKIIFDKMILGKDYKYSY